MKMVERKNIMVSGSLQHGSWRLGTAKTDQADAILNVHNLTEAEGYGIVHWV